MIGSTQRRLLRTWSLTILVLSVLVWPAAHVQGQNKDEKKEPSPKRDVKTPPPAPVQPTPAPIPEGPPSTGFAPPAPGSRPSGTPVFPPQQVTPSLPPPSLPSPPPLILQPPPSVPRFPVTIDPKTPLKDLLPPPSKIKNPGAAIPDELTQVPEVEFGEPIAKDGKAMENTAVAIAKINHLNAKKSDGFVEALRDDRPDLHGLPFAMGDACRTTGDRNRHFAAAVTNARSFLQAGGNADNFWANYLQNQTQVEAQIGKSEKVQREHAELARIAALMQIMAPESANLRLGLVKHLATISHVEATRALAKLAIFSSEDAVRQAAVEALKVRRERDYTEILLQGMRYPWPAVAKRASEAIVKLERKDLLPQLIEMLDETDPRLPVVKEVNNKKVSVIRELVRINHHRNCLLCHAPGNTGNVAAETLTVATPTPDQPLNPPSGGYQQSGSSPDLLVRIDVTYLRQDFSMMQAVADAAPWPEMQRFDFLVRTREVTEEEETALRSKLEKHEKGQITPYQRAAVTALRDLTGKDTGPTAQAWRELLDLQK